jgi:hypothetical protein
MRRCWLVILMAVSQVALTAPLAAREKTDVITFDNGNLLTAEIKRLEKGTLDIKTDFMGDISIEWEHVSAITSSHNFEVEGEDSGEFFGTLGFAPEGGKLLVKGETGEVQLELVKVVRLTPIESTLKDRFAGHVDLGFNYAKAHKNTQFNLGASVSYRVRAYAFEMDLSSVKSDRDDAEETTRHTFGLKAARFFAKKKTWVGTTFVNLEQNEELDLDLRAIVGAGVSRYLFRTHRNHLVVGTGLAYNHERYDGVDLNQNSTEAYLGLQYSFFTFGAFESDLNANLVVFPSITESGRVRSKFDFSYSHEIIRDLDLGLSLYASYDNQPPEGSESSDYGAVTSVGWSF